MPDGDESNVSAAGSSSKNANNTSRPGGDRLKVQGPGTVAGTIAGTTAATGTPSPQRPRHHFTRSLSELSSPLRLRRHSQSQSQSQSQSPGPGHNDSPGQNQNQNQSQSRRNNSARDNRDYQDGRGPSMQTNVASTGPTTGAATSSSLAPASPSQSLHLSPLSKSRTTGSMSGVSLASAAVTTGNHTITPSDGYPSGSTSSNRTATTSAAVSPNTSRQPSVHANKDHSYNPDDYRLQQSQTHDNHHHHHHSHRHHHHNHSASSSIGYMSSHSTTIAALAAAATAVAAASPTTPAPSLHHHLSHVPTNATGGFPGSEADRSQDELLLQQQQERQASTASGAGLSSSGLPIDAAAVRAAAANLQRMQREQSRNAARVLQSAVTDLDGLSTATSQRLDAAYGSVLSRVAALQDTVLALRSLAAAARATNRRFTAETESITYEIDQQVQQLEGDGVGVSKESGGAVLTPADQQHRLEKLSARVHRGRQAIQDLSERVEKARGRVELWERADRAWQERTRTRLKVLWVIVSSVVLTLVVLLVVMVRHSGGAVGTNNNGNSSILASSSSSPGKPDYPPGFSDLASVPTSSGKFHLSFPNGSANSNNGDGTSGSGQEDDPLRRLFDEL